MQQHTITSGSETATVATVAARRLTNGLIAPDTKLGAGPADAQPDGSGRFLMWNADGHWFSVTVTEIPDPVGDEDDEDA